MLKRHDPEGVAPPFSTYSHGVEVPVGARWLHVSGQVGVTPEGALAGDVEAQIEQSWLNLMAVLESAGMTAQDLVKVTIYLLDPAAIPQSRVIRDRVLEGARPASTLVIVAGLASPDWQVEIEAIAAKAD